MDIPRDKALKIQDWKAHYNVLRRDIDDASAELFDILEKRRLASESFASLVSSETLKLNTIVEERVAIEQAIGAERAALETSKKVLESEKIAWEDKRERVQKETDRLISKRDQLYGEHKGAKEEVLKIKNEIKLLKSSYNDEEKRVKKYNKLLEEIADAERALGALKSSHDVAIDTMKRELAVLEKKHIEVERLIKDKAKQAERFKGGLLKARQQILNENSRLALYRRRLAGYYWKNLNKPLPPAIEVEIPEIPDIK